MSLIAGTRLGPYEITGPLGSGGMGEVYRARDTKLDRDVAIKILPDSFAHDAERVARFTREAKTLAALNHPHIAQIHGLEEARGIRALVMELVEGPTLADRIGGVGGTKVPPLQQNARGAGLSGLPIPIDEALSIAKQIAEALEAAHEHGIIHRDLKPANIKVKDDGTVKVLDFGLAKALDPVGGASGAGAPGDSPTITSPAALTDQGVILGTAAYMPPEQAKGRAVDKRADIWAFGCVLFEMLTGKRAFDGENVFATLTAVVRDEPDWKQLPTETPRRVIALVQRCLKKDARERLRDIGDARIEIEDTLAAPAEPQLVTATSAAATRRERLAWSAVVVVLLALVAAGALSIRRATPSAEPAAPAVTRLTVVLPQNQGLEEGHGAMPPFAISPDGSRLVLLSAEGGQRRLYLRRLGSFDFQPISGSEEAVSPFFSPDGEWVAFFADRHLRKVSLSGAAAVNICEVAFGTPSGAWGRDGNIVFAPGISQGLFRVSANGGTPEALTTPANKMIPMLLPTQRHVLYTTITVRGTRLALLSLETREERVLESLGEAAGGRYVSTGHLLFLQQGRVLAAPFDLSHLEVIGPSVPILNGVRATALGYTSWADVSETGTLAYVPGPIGDIQRSLVWVDRTGHPTASNITAEGLLAQPRLAPDGVQVAFLAPQGTARLRNIWTYDLRRGSRARVTTSAGNQSFGVWAPDSRRLAFASNQTGAFNVYWTALDGNGEDEALLPAGPNQRYPSSWSADGRFLAFYEMHPINGRDIWVLPLTGDRTPVPVLTSPANERAPAFSPNSRFLAYVSDESGRDEVYVREYPGSAKWLISTDGGAEPVWRRDGRELFYRHGDQLLAVPVTTSPAFTAGRPAVLFAGRYEETAYVGEPNYDVSPDGQRFVMVQRDESGSPQQLNIVQNWFEELNRLVAAGR